MIPHPVYYLLMVKDRGHLLKALVVEKARSEKYRQAQAATR
jgi:hypothetical protein